MTRHGLRFDGGRGREVRIGLDKLRGVWGRGVMMQRRSREGKGTEVVSEEEGCKRVRGMRKVRGDELRMRDTNWRTILLWKAGQARGDKQTTRKTHQRTNKHGQTRNKLAGVALSGGLYRYGESNAGAADHHIHNARPSIVQQLERQYIM